MSGIAGTYHFGGKPADPAALARLTGSLAHRGPDGEGQWVGGPVSLGHRLLHTTPESFLEKQPVAGGDGGCQVAWDGRLDNRDELLAMLEMSDAGAGRDRTDPEIVAAAYERWGESALARLEGDFALAVWDSRRRRLLGARDAMGAKPFYYHRGDGRLVFASEVTAILSDPATPARPDERTLVDFLLMDFRDHEATFFSGIRQVPPGHVVVVDETGVRLQRYREVSADREIRYARDSEYLEAFHELLAESVRARLRSHAPLGLLLSGGIDSTAVAAVAGALRGRDPGLPSVIGACLRWDEFLAEEQEAILALAGRYGTRVRWVTPERDGRRLTKFELGLAGSEAVHHDWLLTIPLLTGPISEAGCRALLTGFGADELVGSGEIGYLQDLLRAPRPLGFLRELRRMARAYGTGLAGNAASLAWSAAPAALRRAVKRATGRTVPAWLAPDFARRMDVAGRSTAPRPRRFPTACQEATYRAITSPALALALVWMDRTASESSLECRHPFLDRRLAEFFLAIPGDVKVRRGYRKMFLQDAIAPIAAGPLRPVESRAVVVGSMAREAWTRTDAERLPAVLFRPDAMVFEYVDRRAAEQIRDRYLAGEARWRNLLWQFAKLELWLRAFVGGPP